MGVMIKAVYAVAAAAIVAGAFVAFLGLSLQVEARGSVPNAKADRADTRAACDCVLATRMALFRSHMLARCTKRLWRGSPSALRFVGPPDWDARKAGSLNGAGGFSGTERFVA